jgi:hypothetical protein
MCADDMKEPTAVSTSLSFAQLVANSKKMKEDMLGRSCTEEEVAEIEVTSPFPCQLSAARGCVTAHPSHMHIWM